MEKINQHIEEAAEAESRLASQAEVIAAELMAVPADRDHTRIEQALATASRLRHQVQRCVAAYDASKRDSITAEVQPRHAADAISDAITDRKFADIRYRFASWSKALADIEFLAHWKGAPLFETPSPQDSYAWQQVLSLDEVIQDLHRAVNPHRQSTAAETMGCFADIGLRPLEFTQLINAAFRLGLAQHRDNPMTFLDVGCGAGLKVMQAAQLFQTAHGLEYDNGYVETARSVLSMAGREPCKVFHADARQFDRYHEYDVIYLYRPMHVEAGLIEIEEQILPQLKAGTLLIYQWEGFARRAASYDIKAIENGIYVSGYDSVTTKKLAASARMMLPCTMSLPRLEGSRYGYLAPIMEVSRHLGYGRN